MPAVIPLVVAGVGAFSSYEAAKKASNTAKQASQVQVDASNKAMDLQQQSQQRALDFINQQQNRPTQPMTGAAWNQLQARTGGGAYGGLMGGSQQSAPPPPIPKPNGLIQQPTASGGYLQMLGQPSSAPPSQPPATGGMVTLRAPTGETGTFPPDVAQQLIARGATRIS